MTGIFSNLYLVLQAKLKGITLNEQPLVRYITEDTGQLMDENPAISYPCILLNMDDLKVESLGQNAQIGVINVCFRLVCDVYSSSSSITPLATIEKAMNYKTIESLLHTVLQGYCPSDDLVPVIEGEEQPDGWPDVFGSFDRISSRQDKQHPALRVQEMIYSIGFQDYSTQTPQLTIPATPAITDTIQWP